MSRIPTGISGNSNRNPFANWNPINPGVGNVPTGRLPSLDRNDFDGNWAALAEGRGAGTGNTRAPTRTLADLGVNAGTGSYNDGPSYNTPAPATFNPFAIRDQQFANFRDQLAGAMGQMWNVNQANQLASLANKSFEAQVLAASLPAQYQAQAAMYGSDNNLKGTQINADAARYQSDNTLAGNKYGSDATVQATGLTANSALASAQAQAAAQQAAAQAQANATLQAAQAQANAQLEGIRLQQAAAQQINQTRTNAMLQALGGFGNVARDIFGGLGGSLGGLLGGGGQQGQGSSGSAFSAPTFDDPYKQYANNTKLIAQLRGA